MTTAMNSIQHALAYVHGHRPRFVVELGAFIRFPSVSAQPQHAQDLARCAAWLAHHLHEIGLEQVSIIPTARHPIVCANWHYAAGRPTGGPQYVSMGITTYSLLSRLRHGTHRHLSQSCGPRIC